MDKGTWGMLAFYAMIAAFVAGVIISSCNQTPYDFLRHSCSQACQRSDSEMVSVVGNLCVCKNLSTMRGDYGQLFLHGEK